MIIRQTRILSLARHLGFLEDGASVKLGVRLDEESETMLQGLGFPAEWSEGLAVLPPASFGPASRRNAEGDVIVHDNEPMETAYHQREWTRVEWRGPYREETTGIVDVPYRRYPRTFVPPAAVELVTGLVNGERALILNQTFQYDEDNARLRAGVNLLLEIFGTCEIFTEALEALGPPEVRRLNWHVLPPGRHPWAEVWPHVEEAVRDAPERKRPVYIHRWRTINEYGAEFVAVGKAGFRGYWIFGFPDRDIFVLESAHYGNATYILGANWETLSRLTKAELLADELHEERVIHREGWEQRIAHLLA